MKQEQAGSSAAAPAPCANDAHKPRAATFHVTWPSGRFVPTTACVPCAGGIIREAASQGLSVNFKAEAIDRVISHVAAPHEVVVNTPNLYRATIDAWYAVEKELDVEWTARQPIQGEATYKVFAYRIALATVEALIADGWSKADV